MEKRLISAGKISGGVMTHVVDLAEVKRQRQRERLDEVWGQTMLTCPALGDRISDEHCRARREAGLTNCSACDFNPDK